MPKSSRTRSIPAGQFKAGCLALLDEVASTGETLIVTKRGRPVAQITPVTAPKGLAGSIKQEGDLISPIGDTWESEA